MVNLKVRTPSQAVSIFPSKMVFLAAAISRSILRRVAKPYVFPRRWISGGGGASGVDGITAAGYHVAGGPSFMRGTVFWEPNRPLTIEEFHMPKPKAGEILIKTKGHGWILRFQFVFAFASPVSCLQIARAFGAAEIIAVDVLDEKLQNAKMLGATHTINGLKEDVVDKIKVDILISSFPSVPGL
ncbi:hypothetical protein BHE74_00038872 [Ensete ventricosum]|nr:hypothetical protein BHE74_00038872 [Ensete ventricosum]